MFSVHNIVTHYRLNRSAHVGRVTALYWALAPRVATLFA